MRNRLLIKKRKAIRNKPPTDKGHNDIIKNFENNDLKNWPTEIELLKCKGFYRSQKMLQF